MLSIGYLGFGDTGGAAEGFTQAIKGFWKKHYLKMELGYD